MNARQHLGRLRRFCILLAAVWLLTAFVQATTAGEGETAPPAAARAWWTTSRLIGSPEPPLDYTVEKTFQKLSLTAPIYLAEEPHSNYLLLVERGGEANKPSRIVRIKNDPNARAAQTFFELPGRLIYAICFDLAYCANRWLYVFTNGPTSQPERMDRISRYRVVGGSRPHLDAKSEEVILEWPSSGHDGGDLVFGNDGMLYISTGDGSSDSDTYNSGQTLDDLLGAILRIDVRRRIGKQHYAVPRDNPFVKTPGARGEIWAYGLRNPWRLGVDRRTGHIWVGNNGQDQWETAHLVRRGENYGWSVYEGSHPFYLQRQRGPTPLVLPTIEHSHAEFRSLTGGVVYYGNRLPQLNGAYIYGDYSSGRIWGMKHDGRRVIWHRELADTQLSISGFRVDPRGNLLVLDLAGGIYRIVPAPKSPAQSAFPELLSQTGLFASTSEHRVASGVIPYWVNLPGWADGAHGERFMALAAERQVGFDAPNWSFADGTALVQTLSLEREVGKPASRFRVETRVLVRQQGEWAGYSYRWNDEQTDASLVGKNGGQCELALQDPHDGSRLQTWRFPSRAECMACHSRAANYVLGLTTAQLNREVDDPGGSRDNQLIALDGLGVFSKPLAKAPAELPTLARLDDESSDVETRARAYLHVNCSVCHVAAGGGNARMELSLPTPRERMEVVSARPQHDIFGIDNAMLIAPGDPQRSVLLARLSRRTRGQMPPLGTMRVDDRAVELLTRWIAQLKPDKPIVQRWQLDDLLPALDELNGDRSLEAGKTAFRTTGCAQCHRFGGEGGSVGPDLSGIGKRKAARELLESILLPSKVVADEFANYSIETSNGRVVIGRIERETPQVVVIRPPAADDAVVQIAKSDVVGRKKMNTSNMPEGTVNVLHKEEVLDLLAYLIRGAPADPKAPSH